MAYLTETEFEQVLGFEPVEGFDKLLKRASSAIDLFTQNFYQEQDFETDVEPRKQAVKRAVAFQIAYLDSSGVMTAEDKASLSSLTVGRTSVSYQKGAQTARKGLGYNLSLDAENWLRQAGFDYAGVSYDR